MPKPEVDMSGMDMIDLTSSDDEEEEEGEGPVIQGIVHQDFEHGMSFFCCTGVLVFPDCNLHSILFST